MRQASIVGIPYTIEEMPEVLIGVHLGTCNQSKQSIMVDTTRDEVRTTTTLLHEIIHAIQDESAFNNLYDELEINIMANNLYVTLKELGILSDIDINNTQT